MVATVLLALLVQAGVPDSVPVTGEPNPAVLFGGRRLHIVHLQRRSGRDSTAVWPGDTLGTVEPRPVPLSARYQRTIDSASALYQRREFAAAAALLAPAYADERDNLFVADEYARTLFWIDTRRNESFEVYRQLIDRLDRQYGANDREVVVDAWFSEAYWKIASLYLDRADWEHAAFEIARFLSVRSNDANAAALTQVYNYFAEATVHLDRHDLTRWAAEQALRANPRNTEVIGYLRQLGPAARDWPVNHIFACRVVTDSLPCRGGYVFYRGALGISCMVPRQEMRTPLSPCLRIGWVYVGQPRRSVEAVLGAPWKNNVTNRGDGSEGDAYLAFADDNGGSYYIIEYERVGTEQIVRSAQFTGDVTPLPTDFSGLRLGDSSKRVLLQLGSPETRGEFNDQDHGIKGEWWDWKSNGISFEIVASRVYSVRLWRPDNVPPAVIRRDFMRFR